MQFSKILISSITENNNVISTNSLMFIELSIETAINKIKVAIGIKNKMQSIVLSLINLKINLFLNRLAGNGKYLKQCLTL